MWTRPEALRLASHGTLRARVASGAWQQPFRGIYVTGDEPMSAEEWGLAATLASGGQLAVASGRTAARVWRLPLIDDRDPATSAAEHLLEEVSVRTALRCAPAEPPGHVLRRARRTLTASEVVWHPGGFWLTTALRTAVDCAAALQPDAAVCLLDAGLQRALFTADDLASVVARRQGQPGCRALGVAVSRADGRSESPAETLARLILLPVLPGLVPQVRVWDGGRIVARFDLADEEIKLAFEADGKRGHAGEQMVAKDRARDRLTERLGWWTERCTWWELRCASDELVARVLWRAEQLRSRAA